MSRSFSGAIALSFLNDELHTAKRNNQTDSAMHRRKVLVGTAAVVVLLTLAYNYIGRPSIFLDAYRKLPDAQAIPALRDVLQARFPVGGKAEAAVSAMVTDGADCQVGKHKQQVYHRCTYGYSYFVLVRFEWIVVINVDDSGTIQEPIIVNRGATGP